MYQDCELTLGDVTEWLVFAAESEMGKMDGSPELRLCSHTIQCNTNFR